MLVTLGKSKSDLIVPYKELVPYQGVILRAYEVISLNNPIGLGFLIGSVSALCILFYILDPPLLTSIALFLLICVWVDYLLPLLKKDKEQSLAKDEKLKDIYHKYVYAVSFISKLWGNVRSYRKDNEYIYVALTTMTLVATALLGKTINNILLVWAFLVSSIAVLAAFLDGDLKTK
jgi:hypothetical protein